MLRRRPSPAVVIASVALVIALGGVTYAAIPASDGTIHSCYDQRGTLHVIDSSASCPQGETALNFSQTGPQGAQGAQGPQGQPGESKLLNFTSPAPLLVARKSGKVLGGFDLPAGKWRVTFTGGVKIPGSAPFSLNFTRNAKAQAQAHASLNFTRGSRGFSWGANVSCKAVLGDGSVRQTFGNGGLIGLLLPAVQKAAGGGGGAGRTLHETLSMQMVADLPTDQHGTLSCVQGKAKGGISTPNAEIDDFSIIAVKVGDAQALNFTRGR